MRERVSVLVEGVVQGVGFRPFVFNLAIELGLDGCVGNDTEGVSIEIEGERAQIDEFVDRLQREAPPLSRIDAIAVKNCVLRRERGFRIESSSVHGRVATGIPADAATCAACLKELLDPTDRRYRYPFLNCTHCGPRYTITRSIPYDRPQTSMAVFPMCARCQAEYDDPRNRRFHAQPNACADCGPRVWMVEAGTETAEGDVAVRRTLEMLKAGRIAAIKGIGGFHLAVDATSEEAVERLRTRKHRYGKPLAVMVRDLEAARRLCILEDEEEKLLTSPAHPIVLVRMRGQTTIAPSVAPGLPWLGLVLPYAPLQHLLFAEGGMEALVMTSGNLSEEPIAIDNEEAMTRLAAIADVFLLHNREILQRCDDSVVAVAGGSVQLLRRARGYVPLAVGMPTDAPPLLAVGGHMKNVFALARGGHAYQSQHLGDLESPQALEFFEEALAHLRKTFEIDPQMVAHDLHPAYLSTHWARSYAQRYGVRLVGVQHHHAHIAATVAENKIKGPVIGLALDGTGYGTDETIWGGEVLIVDGATMRRFAHLERMPLPGGDAAVREPWRAALGALDGHGLADAELEVLLGASAQQVRIVRQMIAKKLNAPLTSSLGRLFDAVAAVVLRRGVVDYEAQAAIELEAACIDEPMEWRSHDRLLSLTMCEAEPHRISTAALWPALLADVAGGVSRARIAARFHEAVACGFVDAALAARAAYGIERVALSGGCIHNRRLTALLLRGLGEEGFESYMPQQVSPGDGGLSYGQAVVAALSM